ncbi:MAG TPA: hypothetical protein VGN32_10515 [Ktedonobacterales bacterium]|jgi:transcriptional regulator with XRE-family HTH domain|nr:hypothetical protein [Ktedonobacterales bacterium]
MGQNTGGRDARQSQPAHDDRELMRLKLELVAARERGEARALTRVLAGHPHYVAELTQFAASLVATSGYERAEPTAQTRAIAERARTRALAALFPVAAAPSHLAGGLGARAVASLKALRRAHGLSLAAAARRLGLGLDVVQNLEAGLIRAASVPERLTRALGELLETSAEQIRAALDAQLVLRPALQRDRSANAAELPELDFAEAVRLSPAMTAAQKAEWLAS